MAIDYGIAVAYRFTGEDPVELERVLGTVCSSLRDGGNDVFCSIEHEQFFRQHGWTADRIYDYCRNEFNKRKAVVVFLRSDAPSKGVEYEITDAKAAGKPVLLATPRHVVRYREHASAILEYDSIDDLSGKLRAYDFSALTAPVRS
jgi:hypothetical protein